MEMTWSALGLRNVFKVPWGVMGAKCSIGSREGVIGGIGGVMGGLSGVRRMPWSCLGMP